VATTTDGEDFQFMRAALALARRGLGRVWPNPAVGCVLVQGGTVVGRGWTQPGGRPHAETEALARAGDLAAGATAYVSLEPCDHHGETPPCSQALIDAGISRAVVAVGDPDSRVAGKGLARLEAAKIEVLSGLCEAEAREVNEGFFSRITRGRPLFTLKAATTLDGRIATRTGESQWITGPGARAVGHRMRAEHDAVLVGMGTALADSPRLTCRLPGMEDRSPLRIVADSRLRLPLDSPLVETAGLTPTWVVTAGGCHAERRKALADKGVTVIEAEADSRGRPSITSLARELAKRGLTRVLVEGGGQLAAELLRADIVDRLAWFHAPCIIGADGIPAAGAFDVTALAEAPSFVRKAVRRLESDVLETCYRET
jgi:diaminohydroxyphosphoribosylaminopyrimidine deaminase / 5-amino-6-(5-phosphoribosylamino)uracil reductase